MSSVASSLGVDRTTVYLWCKKNPEYEQALNDSRESFIDIAETQLQTLVKGIPDIAIDEEGNKVFAGWKVPPSESAIIFTLRTLGKRRGFTERQDVDVTTNGKDINGTQLIFSPTPLSPKDIEDIKNLQSGEKNSADAGIPET
ncbi:MAG: hypothetical protein LBP50_04545 [Tannerella sp.]|nr:hypothetical protein [Tannerella sp.]